MTTTTAQHQHQPIVLLLKSKSTPEDKYASLFSDKGYRSVFQTVLDHHFHAENLSFVRSLLITGQLLPGQNRRYGGLIFTSQRAVEAFGNVLAGLGNEQIPNLKNSSSGESLSNYLPLYVVGPATSSLMSSIRDKYLPTDTGIKAEVLGSECGNGDNLSRFILDHYNSLPHHHLYPPTSPREDGEVEPPGKFPLLFLTGEQHRDVIPKTLMSESLPLAERIAVQELVVYEAGIKADLEAELGHTLESLLSGKKDGVMWVVLFSPGSCAALVSSLRGRGLYGVEGSSGRRVYIATIGSTTRDHLRNTLGVEADVCAEKPSPEGLWAGIQGVMDRLGDV